MDFRLAFLAVATPVLALTACGGGGGSTAPVTTGAQPAAANVTSPVPSASGATDLAPLAGGLAAPSGFTITAIASIGGSRGLAFLPDGDLLVATSGTTIALILGADDGASVPVAPQTFATIDDAPDASVAYGGGAIFVGSQHGIWRIPYATGERTAPSQAKIVPLRTGPIAPNSDGDVHLTSSVAVSGTNLYAAVGSSCNACAEVDPTRAAIEQAALDGSNDILYAKRIRNAIALATDPSTGTVWAGGAGQDSLPSGHPYEFFDALTSHGPVADYGWPDCEENQHAYTAGATCAGTVEPLVEFPAYSTLTGAAFYPANPTGAYAFPAAYRGGAFVAAHGSWHVVNGHHVPPYVAFVPMAAGRPTTAVNWNDPTVQWTSFVSGFQQNDQGDNRIGRPSGIAVGPQGSLFVADDAAGKIYRIRPRR